MRHKILAKKHGTMLRLPSSFESIEQGRTRVEELWRQFFSDPSQWWDHTAHKVNYKYPDFKHKMTGVALWINGRANPLWVKPALVSMTPGSISRGLYAWNVMISECVKSDQWLDALKLYNQMQSEGVKPDSFTFARVINACAGLTALEEGRRVHAQVTQSGCESDMFVGSNLVDMYAKCGSIEDAHNVFHKMPSRDVVSWTAMLAGYVKCEQGQNALELYALMQEDGIKPNPVTFAVVLNACASMLALEEGRCIHAQLIQSGCESNTYVRSTLVHMYAKCGSMEEAKTVFHKMSTRDVISWTAMLAGYVKCEQGLKALELFSLMQEGGVKPNTITFVVLLNACASIMALQEGRRVHAQLIESGCKSDLFVGNTLLDMYAKCGSIEDAQNVFHHMPSRDVVSWTALLAGYIKCEKRKKALELFALMQEAGVQPNTVTFVLMLNACASMMALEEGKWVHKQLIKCGCECDMFVGSTLVDMYAKCGSIEDAQRVFDKMPIRNVVSWTVMLAGYVKCEQGQKALKLFAMMQEEGMKPDSVTFVAVLSACASIMALEEGRRIHAKLIHSGFESHVSVGNTLVDMYAKCGSIEDAQRVFRKMPARDVVSWNAMLGGFAMHGLGKEALQLFQEMHQAGVEMNMVTFICLLSACSHGGLVDEGLQLFEAMGSVYGISQSVEHYVCMIDLLGRAGLVHEAEDFLRRDPKICKDSIALMALLGACRNHGRVEMGERVAQQLLESDPDNSAGYVLLANIYAAARQRWNRYRVS